MGWVVTRFDASGLIGAVELIQSVLCCAVLCCAVAVLCCAVAVLCCVMQMKQKCPDLPYCCLPESSLLARKSHVAKCCHFADLIKNCCFWSGSQA